MLGMVVLVGMGERMSERFLPIYLVALGGGTLAIGVLGGLQNLLGALYSYPGGWLAERVGAKRALGAFNLIAIAGYVLAIVAPTWPIVIAASVLFLSWSALSLPATMQLVAHVLPATQRTVGVSLHSLVRRFPMALGPIVGGALIAAFGEVRGIRASFGVAIAMALVALVVQQRWIDEDAPLPGTARPPADPRALWRAFTPELRALLTSDVLIRFCEQIPQAVVVVWCMKTIESPVTAPQFGVLTAIEMATAALCYLPIATLADRAGKAPFVLVTFVFFTLFPLALYGARSFAWLVPVFVLRGLKEFGEPARKALILDRAPADRRAAAFGLYYLIRDTIVSLAAFGGAYLWDLSPAMNLGAAAAFGAFGTLWFAIAGRKGSHRWNAAC